MRIAQHLVLDLALGHGGTEIVFRVDRRLDLFAQHHRFVRRIDLYLELRLLVLLDSERPVAVPDSRGFHHNIVRAQRRVGGHLPRPVRATELVGLQTGFEDLFTLGVTDYHVKSFPSVSRAVILVILGLPHPELEFHFLFRPIHGAVGDDKRLGLFVIPVVLTAEPDPIESQKRQPSVVGTGGDQPLIPVTVFEFVQNYLPVLVGKTREIVGRNLVMFSVSLPDALITEEFDVGLDHGAAVLGVAEIIPEFFIQILAQDSRVVDPHDNATGVAARHFRDNQIRPGLLQRRVDGYAAVPMLGAGIELDVPVGRFCLEIFSFVLGDDPVADLIRAYFVPIKPFGSRPDVVLDVVQQQLDLYGISGQVDLVTVAVYEIDLRGLA